MANVAVLEPKRGRSSIRSDFGSDDSGRPVEAIGLGTDQKGRVARPGKPKTLRACHLLRQRRVVMKKTDVDPQDNVGHKCMCPKPARNMLRVLAARLARGFYEDDQVSAVWEMA